MYRVHPSMTPVPVERCKQSSLVCCDKDGGKRPQVGKVSRKGRGRERGSARTHRVGSQTRGLDEVEEGNLWILELVDEGLLMSAAEKATGQ